MDALNQYIKAVVDDEISKTAIIKRIKGTVIEVAGNTKVVVRLNSPDPVSLPKTVSINNTTGMIVDVGNVVWVYYWKNINDGFILPACMAVKAGVGEFINEGHNSERFNDYTGNSGINVKDDTGVSFDTPIILNKEYITLSGLANFILDLSGSTYFERNELRGYGNQINTCHIPEWSTSMPGWGEKTACIQSYLYGAGNALNANFALNNYLLGSGNLISGIQDWPGWMFANAWISTPDPTEYVSPSYSDKEKVELTFANDARSNMILGRGNKLLGRSVNHFVLCGNGNTLISVPNNISEQNDDSTDIWDVDSYANCAVYGSNNNIRYGGSTSDFDYPFPPIMAFGEGSIYQCDFTTEDEQDNILPNYGSQTLVSGYIKNNIEDYNEIKIAFGFGSAGYGFPVQYINGMVMDKNGNLKVLGAVESSSGADYAEYEEWQDGNADNEDRRGLFVIEVDDKIRIANETDDPAEVLGIVSSSPTVCGDAASLCWKGTVLKDAFGSPIMSEQEVKSKDGEVVYTKQVPVINPEYDPSQSYTNRAHRKEFTPVAYVGKVVAVDDGTCEVNGYCKPSAGGVATKSDTITRFRVRKRIDETHILVRVL